MQPGRGKDRSVHVAVVDLLDARRHVAAQLDDVQIAAQRQQLRATTQARRSDARSGGQLVECRRADDVVHDQHVARIFTLEDRGERQPSRRFGWKIFERMDATIHHALGQVRLELAREQTLASDGAERLVESLVAGRAIGLELGRDATLRQRLLDLPRLTNGELGGARRDEGRLAPPGTRCAHADASVAKCSTIALASPGIVESRASTTTSTPIARAAAVVIGPIDAPGTPGTASRPTASANAETDDAEVKVTRSTPAAMRRFSSSAPSTFATQR